MTPEKCPNCGTKLRRDMLSCPNCPMSFPEDDPASAIHPLKQSKYYQFLLPVLFFAGLGYLIWSMGMGLWHLGEQNVDYDTGPMLRSGPVSKPSETVSGPGTARSEAPLDAPEPPREIMIMAHDSPAQPPAPAAPAAPAPSRPAKAVREWRLRGSVYDLVSLKPLPFCTLIFVDHELNRRIETRTDSSGYYRTVVGSLPDRGYTVQVLMNGYSPTYLGPGTPGVRSMPAAQRRALARDLVATFTSEPATVQAPDAKPLITDFYLAPRP
jgi:hypothetical protein